jgi:transposase
MGKEVDGMYAKTARLSLPPERLLRALLLEMFYSVRSERILREQLNYNVLFRFVRSDAGGSERKGEWNCIVQRHNG